MHRRSLLAQIDDYARAAPGPERGAIGRFRDFVRAHAECFERRCLPGHVTASAWILDADRSRFLLTHHRKLSRWLQLGGHADGDPEPVSVALREAREESGMRDFALVVPAGAAPQPLDLDIHDIPARSGEPAHQHHDVRYLLVAASGQPLVRSHESNELRWFGMGELAELPVDDSVRRLARKAEQWLSQAHELRPLAPG